MKNIKVLLALFAIIVLPVSCSSDGESSDGRDNSIRQRVVSKITFDSDEWDVADEYSFRYDSYGRITRVTHKNISDSNAELCHYERFVYGSNGILTMSDDDDYSREATLNRDGYISEMYDDWDGVSTLYTFSYDKSGRLITNEYLQEDSYDDYYYQLTYTYNWNSGNIVECEYYETDSDDDDYAVNIRYSYNSKLMNMVNLDLNVALGCYWEEFLYIDLGKWGYWGDGLCGQKSKNLLTSVEIFARHESYRYDYRYDINWHYDEDGYPVSADIIGDDDDDSCRVTIEYDDK